MPCNCKGGNCTTLGGGGGGGGSGAGVTCATFGGGVRLVTIGGGGITTITVLVGGCGAGGVTVATVCVAGGETGGLITVLAEVFVGGGVKAVFWMTELEVIFGFGGAVPLPVDLLVLAAGGWLDVFGKVFGTTGGVMEAITGIGLLATGRGKGGG